MSVPFAGLALHTWTLETTPLETALDAVAQSGFDAVELRRSDFKACFDRGMINDAVLDLVRSSGVPVCCLGVEYGWMFATGEESRRLFDVFRQSCENALALGCPMLMSAPGQNDGTIAQAAGNLRIAAGIAAEYGLPLSLEFNSQHPTVNSAAALRGMLDDASCPNAGMVLDAYHLTRSGRGGRGFEEVPPADILWFQYSDVPTTPVGDVKRPTDRLMPGDGIVEWDAMLGLLAEKDYSGYLSFEAPNPALWGRSPHDVAAEGARRMREILDRVAASRSETGLAR